MLSKLKNKLKKIIKNHKIIESQEYGWFGNYVSWKEADNECSGYNQLQILDKVKQSLLKVKNGEAIYERDSVIFNKFEYSWPLLTLLFYSAAKNNNKLHVLDFGGSLGSSYFQNKRFLDHFSEFSWNIVEQTHFVDCGIVNFQNEILRFYKSISKCIESQKINVVLFSSVLQYLEKPEETINEVIKSKVEYIIVDLTSFTNETNHRITVQRVWPEIYDASYPCWFFNEKIFLAMFEKHYSLISSFDISCKSNLDNTYYKGFMFKRNA